MSIYLWHAKTQRYSLYRGSDAELKDSDLCRLLESGITTVYLDACEYSRFQEHLRAAVGEILKDETLPITRRFGVLNEVVRSVLRDSFRWGNTGRTVAQAGDLARHAVDMITRDDFAIGELSSVLYFDYGTFTHSANVAYYALLLAQSLGEHDEPRLRTIATGALLHDIGKVGIPEQIIGKRGKLTEREWETMRRHAGMGLLNLEGRDEVEFGQLMMVYQHHERMDGTGYPVRLVGDEIHEWARLCAVADVFEALTSNRPYRRRLATADAFEFMQRGAGRGLDPEFLRCWRMTIGTN